MSPELYQQLDQFLRIGFPLFVTLLVAFVWWGSRRK